MRELTGDESMVEWAALNRLASEPNPFYAPFALPPALDALRPLGGMRMLTLEGDGVLAGVVPVRRSYHYYRYPLPHFTNWVHGNCFVGAPLVAKGCEKAFWRAALRWMDEHAGAALFWHLQSMPLAGALFDALHIVAQEETRPFAVVHRTRRAMLQSRDDADAYWQASLSTKKRKELRRQERRLAELGDLRFDRQHYANGLDEWTREFLELEAAGWKGDRGNALARSRSTARLFADTVEQAARAGALERLALRLNGRPIAMLANLIAPPGAFAWKTAYDETYARFSPGVLLQHRNLEILGRSDIEWCDSCAAQAHPMIDRLWRERRDIGHINIGIGSPRRRALYRRILSRETGERV